MTKGNPITQRQRKQVQTCTSLASTKYILATLRNSMRGLNKLLMVVQVYAITHTAINLGFYIFILLNSFPLISTFLMLQQYPFHLLHSLGHSGVCFSRSQNSGHSTVTAVPVLQATSSIPPTLSFASFRGLINAPLWLLSHANCVIWGERSGSRLNAELGPLSPDSGSTLVSGVITELGALSPDSIPNKHNLYSVYYM